MAKVNSMETYILNKQSVARHVKKARIGTYILGEFDRANRFIRRYVGRSTTRLHERLNRHVTNNEWPAFQFHYWETPEEVFQMECLLFHHNRDTIVNKRHPDAPRGLNYKCPYCVDSREKPLTKSTLNEMAKQQGLN